MLSHGYQKLLKKKYVALQASAEAAEEVLRSLASWLGSGGYNAATVDPEVFEKKIRDGVDMLLGPHLEIVKAAKALAKLPNVENRVGAWKDVNDALKELKEAIHKQLCYDNTRDWRQKNDRPPVVPEKQWWCEACQSACFMLNKTCRACGSSKILEDKPS